MDWHNEDRRKLSSFNNNGNLSGQIELNHLPTTRFIPPYHILGSPSQASSVARHYDIIHPWPHPKHILGWLRPDNTSFQHVQWIKRIRGPSPTRYANFRQTHTMNGNRQRMGLTLGCARRGNATFGSICNYKRINHNSIRFPIFQLLVIFCQYLTVEGDTIPSCCYYCRVHTRTILLYLFAAHRARTIVDMESKEYQL